MPITYEQKQAVDEAFRRKATGVGSSVGIGASNANSLSPSNPIANQGSTQLMTNPPSIQGGANGMSTDGARTALAKQKGEAERITDSLIKRQRVLEQRSQQGVEV